MEILSINQWVLSHLQIHRLIFRNTDHAVKPMVRSIRVYGSRTPLLLTRAGEMIDEPLRAKAARFLGLTQLPVHGTQKPVDLLRRPILNHTGRGELAYHPSLGSGTTLSGAEQTARVGYGLAIDPAYVHTIVLPFEKLSRGEAVREADGQLFSALRKQAKVQAAEQEVNSAAA
jgi:hypothetical protein